jgi:hypothetical protein
VEEPGEAASRKEIRAMDRHESKCAWQSGSGADTCTQRGAMSTCKEINHS